MPCVYFVLFFLFCLFFLSCRSSHALSSLFSISYIFLLTYMKWGIMSDCMWLRHTNKTIFYTVRLSLLSTAKMTCIHVLYIQPLHLDIHVIYGHICKGSVASVHKQSLQSDKEIQGCTERWIHYFSVTNEILLKTTLQCLHATITYH